MTEDPLDRVKSLDAIADELREAVGQDDWFDIPQRIRLRLVYYFHETRTRAVRSAKGTETG